MKSILDVMPFGKCKGELIGTVIEEEPEYVFWMINNTNLRLDESAEKYLKECME